MGVSYWQKGISLSITVYCFECKELRIVHFDHIPDYLYAAVLDKVPDWFPLAVSKEHGGLICEKCFDKNYVPAKVE